MQDSSYLDYMEVSEPTQQLNTTHDMIVRNNKTGFQFLSSTSRYFRVYFKIPINIALVEILTPRSNVKQIRLSYFDEFNKTLKDPAFQQWPINYISEYGRENNSLNKLCPNLPYRGIRVEILQTDSATALPHNVTLKVFVRNCEGVGGRIRKLCSK
jgi:hypothetical protein